MKIKWYLTTDTSTNPITGEFDVPDAKLARMMDHQKHAYIESLAKEEAFNFVEWGWRIAEEGEGEDE